MGSVIHMNKPDISVITPSFNMLPYLKRCAASVADQKGISVEHIIVDNISNDGTIQWLKENNNVKKIIKPDIGMFDVINKGLKYSEGNIFSYLNCDEQFLPGTLEKVFKYFNDNDDIDIVYGNVLFINEDNSLIAFRKSIKPRYYYILAHYLYTFTCTLFFRKTILDDGHLFNTNYQTVSDAMFVANLIKEKYNFGYLNEYISVFTLRKNNLSLSSLAKKEQQLLKLKLPFWIRKLDFILLIFRYTENILTGVYKQNTPLEYDIFVKDNLKQRQKMVAKHVSPFYKQH